MAPPTITASDRQRFARARERGATDASAPNAVTAASYSAVDDTISLAFRSGAQVVIPRISIPQLAHVAEADLATISVSPAGNAVSWRSADVDISVPGLIRSVFLAP
jgi:hypothetical protein